MALPIFLGPDVLNSNLHTFVAITGLMGCLMSLVLFFLKRSYPESIKGLGSWSAVPVLAFLASALYGMQGQWHHLLSMALPNFLVVVALLIQTHGTFAHLERPFNSRLALGIAFVSLTFFLWSSGKTEYFVHRLVFVSGLLALVFGAQLKTLWTHRHGSFATHCMLLTVASLSALMAFRVATALIEPPPVGIYTYSPLQAIYLASFGFGVLLLSISSILMSAERLHREMEKLLKYDALTGTLTRRASFEYGADELARSARVGSAFSVMLLDLDRFKAINDQYGHQEGDRVLIEFAQAVESVLRRPSAIGRYGGEEFIVLLPDTDRVQAVQVAERIRQALRARTMQPEVTVSIGVATCRPVQDSLDAVIGRADAAMYAAKRNGRDRIEVEGAGVS